MKIIGNPDWTNPAVRLKNAIVAPARKALALAGGKFAEFELEDVRCSRFGCRRLQLLLEMTHPDTETGILGKKLSKERQGLRSALLIR